MKEFKVSSSSNVKSVAGAISGALKEAPSEKVVASAIGASAISQIVKSIAISRGHLALAGYDLITRIGFDTTTINDEEKTCMKFFLSLE